MFSDYSFCFVDFFFSWFRLSLICYVQSWRVWLLMNNFICVSEMMTNVKEAKKVAFFLILLLYSSWLNMYNSLSLLECTIINQRCTVCVELKMLVIRMGLFSFSVQSNGLIDWLIDDWLDGGCSLLTDVLGVWIFAVEENAPINDVENEETERESGAGDPVDCDGPGPSQLLHVERVRLVDPRSTGPWRIASAVRHFAR